MKITLLAVGKTDADYFKTAYSQYEKRLVHYNKFGTKFIPDVKKAKNLSMEQQKEREGEQILKEISPNDVVVLLDERGTNFSSLEFSDFMQKRLLEGMKTLFFVIGGPYGFSEKVYQRANYKISLSRMTFSHQFVRVIFIEQLYRAFTILKGEPYHHE